MGWPRYDPRTGFWLCENCWNRTTWAHHCHKGLCECPKRGCPGHVSPPKIAFTGEGQTKLTDLDLGAPLDITNKS